MSINVFVTGGTGALGQPVVRRLVAAGHRVRVLTRSDDNVATLRALGAEPVPADLFDPASLHAAVRGADAVLHLATRIPEPARARKRDAWRENDRIRREGTRNLVTAALDAGAAAFVYPSVAFVYPDSGDAWIDAATTAPRPASDLVRSTLDAEAEVGRFSAGGGRGVVLRMGQFYGRDPLSFATLHYARRGIAPVFGRRDAFWSMVWIDDAAEAVIAAVEPRTPAGIFDVVDDEPLRRRELVEVLARAAGRRRLWRIPTPLVRLMAGAVAGIMTLSLRVSNRRFREAAGWAPRVPSARDGWPLLQAELAGSQQAPAVAATGAPPPLGRS